jgi:hypothetical protein
VRAALTTRLIGPATERLDVDLHGAMLVAVAAQQPDDGR